MLEKLKPYLLNDNPEDRESKSYYNYFPDEYLDFIKNFQEKFGFENGTVFKCESNILQTNDLSYKKGDYY